MARSNSRVPPRGRRRAAVAALAVVAAVLTAPPVQGAVPDGPAGASTTVIVELAPPPALAAVAPGSEAAAPDWSPALHRARSLDLAQQAVAAQASAAGVDLTVTHHLTAAYNGFVARLPAGQVDALADLPGVRAVHPDRTVTVALHDSVPLVGAPGVWDPPHGGAGSTGAGVTVAVLDTGIDYTHPDLGGGFGPGHKVVGGYDVVNDDPDPMDDHGHGTHVAGIVAADGQLRGVAPDATLTAYKVLDSSGNGQVSDILAGLDRAVHPDNPHRADVVNLSLSGPGDGADPLSVAAQQAAEAGVVVVAAAGNLGPFPGSVRAPAAAEGVVAVGASASGIRVPRARMVQPVEEDLQALRFVFSANPPSTPVELDVVDVGRGLPGTYDDVDVAGRAVLMEVGDALAQAGHAQQRGAAAVLFYAPDFWGPIGGGGGPGVGLRAGVPGVDRAAVIERDDFPTGIHGADEDRLDLVALQIPGSAAAELQRHLPDGPVRVEISGVDATDLMADFSSRGPTGRFGAKPNLVAPGVEILSTLPGGGYGRASGTSMAAPHVAGAAALLLSLRPELTAREVSALLST
ncbi:MAG TPA: S8 family serine peptidase, partial [Natronosporangium sp.]|nr:S8 family serine peptidase [Natronosporangium sp.]